MNLHITVDIIFKLTVVGKQVTKDNQVYLDFMATNLELQKKENSGSSSHINYE